MLAKVKRESSQTPGRRERSGIRSFVLLKSFQKGQSPQASPGPRPGAGNPPSGKQEVTTADKHPITGEITEKQVTDGN